MALVVVGQLLPEGAVKGGSSMALRFGSQSRFTRDLDVARRGPLDSFRESFEEHLREGWEGFTGRLVEKAAPRLPGIPSAYVMHPFEVKLSYRGTSWCTVPFELGHNEIGDAEEPDMRLPDELAQLFSEVGLPAPQPVPVMRTDHQVAQKLHALSSTGRDRARDLVDLQLLAEGEDLDYAHLMTTCTRLFAYRDTQTWPPQITGNPTWPDLYEVATEGLTGMRTVEDAVDWVNALIRQIDDTSPR